MLLSKITSRLGKRLSADAHSYFHYAADVYFCGAEADPWPGPACQQQRNEAQDRGLQLAAQIAALQKRIKELEDSVKKPAK